MVEFGVHGRIDEADGVRVIGRCFTGPICVGTVFRRMRRYLDADEPAEMSVALQVVEIHAYGHSLDTIDEGMTGALVLSGMAPDALGDGWTLAG
jgi:hypothetical protein